MVDVICVTGSVCSGKTTVAKKLTKSLGWKYLDVNKVIELFSSVVAGFDRRRKCKEIDVDELVNVLVEIIRKSKWNLVIDSHLSHYIPRKYVKCCVVCRCDLKKLRGRLKKRGYSELKIRENLDAEIFDLCLVEALEKRHRVVSVDCSGRVDVKGVVRRLNLNK